MSIFEGVLAYYKLDENDGGSRLDFFGLGPPLSEQSTPKKIAGHIGSGIGSGGRGGSSSTGYLADDVSNSAFFDIQGVDRTFVGWFNPVNYTSSPAILSNWANPGGGVQWLFWHDGANLTFQVRDGSSVDHTVSLSPPSTNAWHFFAFWYNSFTGEIGLRLNTQHSASGNTPSVATITSRFAVGARNSAGAVLNGGVDAVGIYDRVLSSGALNQLYNSGLGIEPPFDISPAFIGGYLLSEGLPGPSGIIGGYLLSKVPTGNNNAGILGGYLKAEPGTSVGPAAVGGFVLGGPLQAAGPTIIGGFADATLETDAKVGGYVFGTPAYNEYVDARARTLVAVTSDLVAGQKMNMEAQIVFKGVFQDSFNARLINVNTVDSGFKAKVEVEKFKRPLSVFIKSITRVAASGEVLPSGQPFPNFDSNGTRRVCVVASGNLGDGDQFISAHIDFGDPFDPRGGFKPFLSVSGFNSRPPWSGCHDYNMSGLYIITARAQDDQGMVGMTASGLNLASGALPGIHFPLISISGAPRFGLVPPSLEVQFSVLSSGLSVPPYTQRQSNESKVRAPTDERILWSFGNRERSVRSAPVTFYQSPGLFSPTLRFLYTNPSGLRKFVVSDTLLVGFNK